MPTTLPPDWVYYLCGILLLVGNLTAWVGTLFMMPGNWIIVALAALSAYFLPVKDGLGFGWMFVAVLGGLAGSYSGSFKYSVNVMKYVVTAVLIIACIKLYMF